MNKPAMIAILCFVVGGLVGAGITYDFVRCKTAQVIFNIPDVHTNK